jgi:glycerol-3-phosphate dehydrogenase
MTHEFARTAEDVVWRRSKLGLRLTGDQIAGSTPSCPKPRPVARAAE